MAYKFYLQFVAWLPQAAKGLIVFLVFWLIGALIGGVLPRLAGQLKNSHGVFLRLVGQIVKITLIAIGAVNALGIMGVDTSALLAGLGLTGFAFGLALKDVISNLIAGLLILFYRPFRKGDWIEVSGLRGEVTDIDLRYTRLQGTDKIYLIPNSMLFNSTVTLAAAEGEQGRKA